MSSRKVKFVLRPSIIIIENEDRKGPWEKIAFDRISFSHKIKNIENKIKWCFQPEHREKIFNKFFKT